MREIRTIDISKILSLDSRKDTKAQSNFDVIFAKAGIQKTITMINKLQ